ncbi:MAG TPA: alkaline phosphatase family protein [Vicinamibacteria bacterium]|jgi:hypothetical protein
MGSFSAPPRVPVGEWAERYLLAAFFAGTAATLVFVVRHQLPPVQGPLTFGLAMWAWWVLGYAAVAAAAGLGAVLLGRSARLSWVPRAVLAGACLTTVVAGAFTNRGALRLLGRLPPPPRFGPCCAAALALCAAGLLLVALSRRRRWPRMVAGAALAAAVGAFAPGVRTADASWARAATGAPPDRILMTPAPRVLLVGIDGADWAFMEPLMARGLLPNLARLRDQGAWGPLRTIRPTLSPVVWTSIATGKGPNRHGITGFSRPVLRGVDAPLPPVRPVRAFGFAWLRGGLERAGQIYERPVTSDMRRVPAFWTIALRERSPVNVVTWWATWPAEPVAGTLVSDRIYWWAPRPDGSLPPADRVTYPPGAYADLARHVVRSADVSAGQARRFLDVGAAELAAMPAVAEPGHDDIMSQFRYFFSAFETSRRLALAVVESGRRQYGSAPDTLVLFRIVDKTSHTSLHDSELADPSVQSPPAHVRRFGRVVSEAYRAVDAALGELTAAFGDGNVVVVSDHGFRPERHGGLVRYNHNQAPDGVFLAAGPDIRGGRVELSIYDVLPLLLRLKGFPIADDLEGRVPEEVLTAEFLRTHALRRVAGYGEQEGQATADSPRVESEIRERLRALGYVQ